MIINNFKYRITGPVGTLPFEILQLIYIIYSIFYIINNCKLNKFLNVIIIISAIYILIIHFIRLLIKYKFVINNTKKYKKISILSLIFLFFIIFNKFNFNFKILIGIIYSLFAILNFIYVKQNIHTSSIIKYRLYLYLFFILYLLYVSKLFYNTNIFPIILGDLIYHIIDYINMTIQYYKLHIDN